MAPKKLKETDLYQPVATFFTASGFDVQAEVKHCDVVATRGEETVIVELKTGLTFALIVQAVERQRICSAVYVAVPASALPRVGSKRTKRLRVLRRLELGLILVNSKDQSVTVTLSPEPFDRERSERNSKHVKTALVEELKGRSLRVNVGGSTGTVVMTAYRETAMAIALILKNNGNLSAKDVKALGNLSDKTWAILNSNHYGWFMKKEKGIYGLSEAGREMEFVVPE